MPKTTKIIITAFTLYMLLCIPALAAQRVGGFVSNTPIEASPNASLDEVWMRHGGARMQYDALMGSIQTNTNGKMRRDPAAVHVLPPLYPQKVRKVSKKTKKVTQVQATKTKVVNDKNNDAKVSPNPSPKPMLKEQIPPKSPYTSSAPAAPQPKTNEAPRVEDSTKQKAPINTVKPITATGKEKHT